MTIATSRSLEALGTRRALAALLLIGICPALFAGVPRLAVDVPAGLDVIGMEESVPTSLVSPAVHSLPEASVARPGRPPRPASRWLDSPSPRSLRAPPGV
ncbi:MAG TPA: hypothetical protein VH854_13505 [Thermoanaerobaculia bacterium]|nr:hypothetical protein [Thermoanaerobaculia bacterium]